MFDSDRLVPTSRTAQPTDKYGHVRLFDLFGFRRLLPQKNWTARSSSHSDVRFSFSLIKWNKWNSRTWQREQGVSPFRTVRHCSTLAGCSDRAMGQR
jgi:hypothetical protein